MRTKHLGLLRLDSLDENTKFSKEHYDDNWELLDEAIGEMKQELIDLQSNGNNSEEIVSLKNQIALLEQAKENHGSTITQIEADFTALKTIVEDAQNTGTANESELASIQQEIETLKDQIKTLESGGLGGGIDSEELESLANQVTAMEKAVSDFRTELSQVESATNTNFENLTNQWSAQLSEITQEMEVLEHSFATAEAAASEAISKATDAQTTVEGLTSQVSDLSKRVDALEKMESGGGEQDGAVDSTELSELKAQITGLEKQLSDISTDFSNQGTEISSLNDSLSSLQDELDVLEGNLTTITANLQAMENKVATVEASLAKKITSEEAQGLIDTALSDFESGSGGTTSVNDTLRYYDDPDYVPTGEDGEVIPQLLGVNTDVPLFNVLYPKVEIKTNVPEAHITFSLEDKTISATVTDEGSVVDLPSLGVWSYVCDTDDATSEKGEIEVNTVAYFNLNLEFSFDFEDFSKCTPTMIMAALQQGVEQEYWEVGDETEITLTTGEELTFAIHGFGHDKLSDGTGNAQITLGMTHSMSSPMPIHSSDSNTGGIVAKTLQTWLENEFYESLPDQWKEIIKPVTKTYGIGGSTSTTTQGPMTIFLFSATELLGEAVSSASASYAVGEGSQYGYYTVTENRLKGIEGELNYWWLRTPGISASNGNKIFAVTNMVGTLNTATATAKYGVSLGFCISADTESEG